MREERWRVVGDGGERDKRERVHVVLAARSTSFFKLFRGGGGMGHVPCHTCSTKLKVVARTIIGLLFFYLVEGSLA